MNAETGFESQDNDAIASLELEQAVIGYVLQFPDAYAAVSHLTPEHFYDGLHQRIWNTIALMKGKGQETRPANLKRHFVADEGMAKVGGVTYLARLAAAAGAKSSLKDNAAAIVEMSIQRRAREIAAKFADDIRAAGPDRPAAAVIAEYQDELAALTEGADFGQVTGGMAGALMGQALEDIEKARQGKSVSWSWGIKALDRMVGRLKPNRLVVLAGRPSQGKSTLAGEVKRLAVLANRGGDAKPLAAVTFSLEMGNQDNMSRMAAATAWRPGERIEYADADEGRVDGQQFYRLVQAQQDISDLPMWFDDRAGRSAGSIAIEARRVARLFASQGKHLGLIIVDHLGYIARPNHKGANTSDELGYITKALKALGKELDATVLLLCQLSREVEKRENKRPLVSDLRSSGEIEQDADAILFVYRDSYYLERAVDPNKQETQVAYQESRGKAEVIVGKNRGGRIGTAHLFEDIACGVMRDPGQADMGGMF